MTIPSVQCLGRTRMTDYAEEQRNELEALEAIYATEFTCEQQCNDFTIIKTLVNNHKHLLLIFYIYPRGYKIIRIALPLQNCSPPWWDSLIRFQVGWMQWEKGFHFGYPVGRAKRKIFLGREMFLVFGIQQTLPFIHFSPN